MSKFKILIIFIFFVCSAVFSFAETEPDLQKKTQQLDRLKQDINAKKAEKDKLVKEEKKVKKELEKISSSISSTEKQLKNLQIKITEAEKNLNYASRQYSQADQEKYSVSRGIDGEVLSYIKRKSVSYFDYPLEYRIRRLSIKDKYDKFNEAVSREEKAKSNIGKYDKAKKKFLSLKDEQETLRNKNKELQKSKSELLKTTAGKRVQAEQEIKALNDSAKALESLVKKLMRANKNKKSGTSLRAAGTARKNNLPWPVDGTIILNYGKNKHPDLDTNLISNGIKIKAQNNAIIKAVDDGVVVFTGEFRSYGKIIIIDHKEIFFSVYGHLNNILVNEDQKVVRGGSIANLGIGDDSVLYFEIRQYNVPEDPKLWLKEKK